jgi:hypothetical protein
LRDPFMDVGLCDIQHFLSTGPHKKGSKIA